MKWKLLSKCEACKKFQFLLVKPLITIPSGQKALSKKFMCISHGKALNKVLNSQHG